MPKAYKLCAQQTAKTGGKPRRGFSTRSKKETAYAVSFYLCGMDYRVFSAASTTCFIRTEVVTAPTPPGTGE